MFGVRDETLMIETLSWLGASLSLLDVPARVLKNLHDFQVFLPALFTRLCEDPPIVYHHCEADTERMDMRHKGFGQCGNKKYCWFQSIDHD